MKFVSNFTDVDDKLIKAANELGEEVPTIAKRRQDSVYQALLEVDHEVVLVHDGARPFISRSVIHELAERAWETGRPNCVRTG